MKTKMILLAVTMLLGSSAFAETPYARNCRITGGQFWVVDVNTKVDLSLCLFGDAAIGAAELAHYKWNDLGIGMSITTFQAQTAKLNVQGVCNKLDASSLVATDSSGHTWNLCVFADNSVIEAHTLANGVNSPANAGLVEALK
ncbi:hypothetical protein [Bdellovibrio sp. HCB337]|uniref:hypothetical protein n=1 Tax=Bdellovibrio sp. HCB337 TaxID=3394358 RepID=UPI0039A515D0